MKKKRVAMRLTVKFISVFFLSFCDWACVHHHSAFQIKQSMG